MTDPERTTMAEPTTDQTPADELRQAAAKVRKYAHLFEDKAEDIAESMRIAATAWEDCERRGFRRTETSAGGRILAVARAINASGEGA